AKVMVFAELYRKNHELKMKEEETKSLNSAIIAANLELAAQYAAIEKHVNELKIKNQELDAFAYISSHDLQEPLRKIQTFSNMILSYEEETLSDNGKQKLQKILAAAERMRQLINSLLTFSRTTITEDHFEKIALQDIVEDIKD